MSSSLIFAFMALGTWGLWGVFSKFATLHIGPASAIVYEIIGSAIVVLLALIFMRFRVDTHPMGIFYAILTGMCVAGGSLFFLIALSRGNAAVTTVLTALYPVVTLIILYAFFHEALSIRQWIGIVLSFVAMTLFVL